MEQNVTTPIEMALANIPRVTERRSISRSGMAVITLVFDDRADNYWARELVSQQLSAARELITGDVDIELAPISTGSAEIPTDPMPVERADMLVALRPKKEWMSARTKDTLQEKMEKALEAIPGLEVELSQPIQMRNNELITGIRQDVAVKIYGEDTEVLSQLAAEVARLIRPVEGVGEPYVEKAGGLPQLQIRYDRERLSEYGISVREINDVLQTAFAGKVAGKVYEGSRSYDIVLRIDNEVRNELSTLESIFIPAPSGTVVPLRQLAAISYQEAPAQISHEDGERSIYVGFNVKGRDVGSTVQDIRAVLDNNLRLPSGYHYTYGGEFENMQGAARRLSLAIPAALLLILMLLFATLRNLRETLFVATAIPLSAIGGILALWLRGMPLSISAAIGFIALSGVAVLNGIVLVGEFNRLENSGMADRRQRILKGCGHRLRPVVMTALVASLGFLPMALSRGDGAEVQRPLATVVIGGLVTATILTLFVIPAIYNLFSEKNHEN